MDDFIKESLWELLAISLEEFLEDFLTDFLNGVVYKNRWRENKSEQKPSETEKKTWRNSLENPTRFSGCFKDFSWNTFEEYIHNSSIGFFFERMTSAKILASYFRYGPNFDKMTSTHRRNQVEQYPFKPTVYVDDQQAGTSTRNVSSWSTRWEQMRFAFILCYS